MPWNRIISSDLSRAKQTANWLEYKGHQGESLLDLQNRAFKAFSSLCETLSPGENVAVYSHGGLIRMLLAKLLDLPAGKPKFIIDNTGVSKIKVGVIRNLLGTSNLLVESLNDCAHLE